MDTTLKKMIEKHLKEKEAINEIIIVFIGRMEKSKDESFKNDMIQYISHISHEHLKLSIQYFIRPKKTAKEINFFKKSQSQFNKNSSDILVLNDKNMLFYTNEQSIFRDHENNTRSENVKILQQFIYNPLNKKNISTLYHKRTSSKLVSEILLNKYSIDLFYLMKDKKMIYKPEEFADIFYDTFMRKTSHKNLSNFFINFNGKSIDKSENKIPYICANGFYESSKNQNIEFIKKEKIKDYLYKITYLHNGKQLTNITWFYIKHIEIMIMCVYVKYFGKKKGKKISMKFKDIVFNLDYINDTAFYINITETENR